jgi:multidrug efflux pump subunit AcrA (membrane-fusion protein)
MKRLGTLLLCVALASTVACGSVASGSIASSRDVPTVTVARENFERRVLADGYLEAAEATPITAPQDSETPMKIAWIAEEGASIAAGEVVVRFDPTEMERQLRDSQGDVESALLSIKKERELGTATLSKRDQSAAQAQREIESAKTFSLDDEDAFARQELIDAQIDIELAQAKAEHARAVKQVERSASRSRVELLEITRRQADNEVARAREALERLEVESPNAGIFVLERDWRGQMPHVGDTVWPGQKLAELPVVSSMQASLFVLEADAGDLEEGLRAEVIIEAHPGKVYSVVVERIDTLAQPRHHEVPVQYFSVILEFEATDAETMKVGQRVRATLFIEQPDALVLPRQAVFEDDGHYYVYRATSEGFERVDVQLGPSSAGRVVIEAGVDVGDEIALRDPNRSADELLDVSKQAAGADAGAAN